MSAFLPVSEIANVGRQLADTLGSTRRLHAVEQEVVPVTDGAGVNNAGARRDDGVSLSLDHVFFSYAGTNRPALADVSFDVAAGGTVALVDSWPMNCARKPWKRFRLPVDIWALDWGWSN